MQPSRRLVAPRHRPTLFWAYLALCSLWPPAVLASPQHGPGTVQLTRVVYPGGHNDPRPRGLDALINETRRRTSIAMAMAVGTWDITGSHPDTPASPLLVWQGDEAFAPLPQDALDRLAHALRMGAALWIDASDGQADGPFAQSVMRDLQRMMPKAPLQPVPSDHVLYKSFYLVDRHGGRTAGRAGLLAITLENRLAVVLGVNDLFGALAKTPYGTWEYMAQDGERAREMAARMGVNWIMYSLCLDYKDDQVHIPFILKRRR